MHCFFLRRKLKWAIYCSQILLVLTFVTIFYYIIENIPKFLSSFFNRNEIGIDQLFILFPILMILMIIGSGALVVFYGCKYMSRLERKDEDKNVQQKTILFAPTEDKPFYTSDKSEDYTSSILPIGLFGSFLVFLVGSIALIGAILEFAGDMLSLATPFIFISVFLSPILYNYRKSIFENDRKPLKKITGGGSISLFSGTVPFFRLLIYDDGLEIRVMFNSFFIPYTKMSEPPHRVGSLTKGLAIKSDLPGVPAVIRFLGISQNDVEIITEKFNEQNEVIVTKSDKIETATSEKEISKAVKSFAIKAAILIFLIHIVSIFSFGLIYCELEINRAVLKSSNGTVYKFGQYHSKSGEAPEKYKYAIVFSDSLKEPIKEVFLSKLGDKTTIKFKNNTMNSFRMNMYSNQISTIFPMFGMIIIILSQMLGANLLRKEKGININRTIGFIDKLQIVGFIMFFSIFIIGPIKMAFID